MVKSKLKAFIKIPARKSSKHPYGKQKKRGCLHTPFALIFSLIIAT